MNPPPFNLPTLSWLLRTSLKLSLIVELWRWWTMGSSHPLGLICFLLNPDFWEGIVSKHTGLQSHLVSLSAPGQNKPPVNPGWLVLFNLINGSLGYKEAFNFDQIYQSSPLWLFILWFLKISLSSDNKLILPYFLVVLLCFVVFLL